MNNYIKIAAFSIALSACHSSDNELANLTIAPKKDTVAVVTTLIRFLFKQKHYYIIYMKLH